MPPHHYRFHTEILYTSRQMYLEAADIFYRQNIFVSVGCGHPEYAARMIDLVTVATGYHAMNFKHHSMEIRLTPTRDDDERLHLQREQYIIAGDDVLQLRNILQGFYVKIRRFPILQTRISTIVSVDISVRGIADIVNGKTRSNNDPISVEKLLEPFRRLHNMRVRVGGHVTSFYKKSFKKCSAEQLPTAADLLYTVSSTRDDGNEALRNGELGRAVTQYGLAVNNLRWGFMRLFADPLTVDISELREIGPKLNTLQYNLGSLLASSYLGLGKYTKSYRYAQCLSLAYSDADLHSGAWYPGRPVCAKIMFTKVLAGKALGQPVQALMDLDVGLKLSPGDEAMKEERIVLCGLVRNKMDKEMQTSWACALNMRTEESKKQQDSVTAQSVARRRDLEALIEKKLVA